MKKTAITTALLLTMTFAATTLQAQDKGFGIGASINGPTGLSYKAWVGESNAIAGALTFNISELNSSFYTHADYLMHSGSGFSLESGQLLTYYGGGVRLTYTDITNDLNFGVRVPLGTTYQFEEAPADIYFELAPTILFDAFNFGLNGAVGFRYYLN